MHRLKKNKQTLNLIYVATRLHLDVKAKNSPRTPKISEHLAKPFFQNLEAVKIETKFNGQQNAEDQYFIRNSMKTYQKWKLLMIL